MAKVNSVSIFICVMMTLFSTFAAAQEDLAQREAQLERRARLNARIELFNSLQDETGQNIFIADSRQVIVPQKKYNLSPDDNGGLVFFVKLSDEATCEVAALDRPVNEETSRFGFSRSEAAYNYQYSLISLNCEDGRSFTLRKSIEARDIFDHIDPGPNHGTVTYEVLAE